MQSPSLPQRLRFSEARGLVINWLAQPLDVLSFSGDPGTRVTLAADASQTLTVLLNVNCRSYAISGACFSFTDVFINGSGTQVHLSWFSRELEFLRGL